MLKPVMNNQARHFYEFGRFRVDAAERRLLRDGLPVSVPPKVFDMLLMLVRNSGHLLTKDELLRTIWPDTFVEENNLTQYISTLRKTLGEDGNGGYIETVPRVGYRFSPGVREVWDEGEGVLVEHHDTYRIVVTQEEREETLDENQSVEEPTVHVALALPKRQLGSKRIALILSIVLLLSVGLLLMFSKARKRAAAAKPVAFKSIAVLPFKSIGGGSGDEHLGLGMADTLIVKLSHLRQINVRPLSAVYTFRSVGQDSLAAGRTLGVDAVLDGRIQLADGRIRVTVELLGVNDGAVLWTQTLDEEFTQVFAVQDRIAEQVVSSLPSEITREERALLAKRYTLNPEAYEAYLKGRFFWNKLTEESLKEAVQYFEQAIKIDPNYSQAYAGLALSYRVLGNYGYLPPKEAFPKARAAAEKALTLDNTLAEAHAALGAVGLFYEWDWTMAERELKRAIELNSGFAEAHHLYAIYLSSRGRLEEAINEWSIARELDPLSLLYNLSLGRGIYRVRRYDEAIEQFQRTLEIDPDFFRAHYQLGVTYTQKGWYQKATEELQKALSLSKNDPSVVCGLAYVYAVSGKESEAMKIINQLKEKADRAHFPPYQMALIYTGLGDKDQAFAWLDKAFEERSSVLILLNVEPRFEVLRSDRRFSDLLRRMNLQ